MMLNFYLIFAPLLFFSSLTLAQVEADEAPPVRNPDKSAEIIELEKDMARLSQESQAAYQQFLMTQELRRNELAAPVEPLPFNPTSESVPVPSYEDMIQRRKNKDDRIRQYTEDLDRLYSRYKSLETEREEIFQKIRELEKMKAEE